MRHEEIVEKALQTVKFRSEGGIHIKVDSSKCLLCSNKACLICPAACYTESSDGKSMVTNFEGCLECGTCLVVCEAGALQWNYPSGSFGVSFKFG